MIKQRILVLDDDPVARDVFSRVLEAEGYEVRSAGTAQQALEAGDSFAPHALISDWMLQEELSGLDVARTLRDRRPDLKIFFVTGLPAENLKHRLDGLAVSKIYEKPAPIDPMLDDLADELSKSGNVFPTDGSVGQGQVSK